MLRSLYTGWTGMYNQQKRLDVIFNNMANATTVGYKKVFATSQTFDELLALDGEFAQLVKHQLMM